MRRFSITLFLTITAIFGQAPQITEVQNAGTRVAAGVGSPVSPQMLVAIMGANLSTSPQSLTANYPWPPELAGTFVTFNGLRAALYYVSQTQINAVVPSGVQNSSSADVVVTTGSGASTPVTVSIAARAIGVFTQTASGCGQLSAYNVHADGSFSLNTPRESLDPLKDFGLAIWLTGLGAFSDRSDGVPWEFNPADNLVTMLGSSFNPALLLGTPDLPTASSAQEAMGVTYAGPAPGLSGVDQINATFLNSTLPNMLNLPPGRARILHQGCNIPMYLTDQTRSASQVVSVSIRDGGGACSDDTLNGIATVRWVKNYVSATSGSSLTDGVTASFLRGSRIGFPQESITIIHDNSSNVTPQPLACAAAYPQTLDMGTISVSGASGGDLLLKPVNSGGVVDYSALLPAGSITGGTYRVTGSGFSDTENIPAPIAITSNLQPGTKLPSALTVSWTGGTDQSVVEVQLLFRESRSAQPTFIASEQVRASTGIISFPGASCAPRACSDPSTVQYPYPKGDVEVLVTQKRAPHGTPAADAFPPFKIPGFNGDAEQVWNYTWDFRSLTTSD